MVDDLLPIFEFAMDLVCMMPPLDEIETTIVSKNKAMVFTLCTSWAACVLLMGAIIKNRGFRSALYVVPLIAFGISLVIIVARRQELIEMIFVATNAPTIVMVITLRFAEGAIIGKRVSAYLRWWHCFVFLAAVILLYHLLRPLQMNTIAVIKGSWALLGVVWASWVWAHMFERSSPIQGSLVLLAVFVVFTSTFVAVSTTGTERILYQWLLPTGLLFGIWEHRHSHRFK